VLRRAGFRKGLLPQIGIAAEGITAKKPKWDAGPDRYLYFFQSSAGFAWLLLSGKVP
jgi:hypothetical protein